MELAGVDGDGAGSAFGAAVVCREAVAEHLSR